MKKLVLMISCFLSFGVQSAEVKEEEKKPLNLIIFLVMMQKHIMVIL